MLLDAFSTYEAVRGLDLEMGTLYVVCARVLAHHWFVSVCVDCFNVEEDGLNLTT